MSEMQQAREVYILSWDQFAFYWQEIKRCLELTDFNLYYTDEWLKAQVAQNNVQSWVLSDGIIRLVFFTRLLNYPRGRILQLFWGYGNKLDEFLELANETMDRAAQAMGADRIEIVGRKGWVRKMRRFGAEIEFYTISRPVGKKGRSN